MKVSRVVPLLLALGGLGAAGWWWYGRAATPEQRFRTVTVSRGDARSVVSATGTVEAVSTVEVGTQVSGIVSEILVDFNDTVKAGQLLARIDPTLLQADVAAAEARVAAARANEARTRLELDRIEALHARAAATDQEREQARAAWGVDRAEVQSAEVALRRARRNLGYTDITSPIDGTVVRRDVDPGQTVNAGFSAPTLFVVVGDLARVEVVAAVDEADIGRVTAGQTAEVTVSSWPDKPAAGTVRQVRLQSVLQDNVVTYPVVVEVENADGRLLPGMTATVELVVAEAKDVLCAPNAALRYQPDASAPFAPGVERPAAPGGGNGGSGGGSGGGAPAAGAANGPSHPGAPGARPSGGRSGRGGRGGPTQVWTVDAEGRLSPITVTPGIRGATCTEVTGEGVTEGLALVVGVETGEAGGSTSPFAAPTAGGFRPGGF